MDTVYVEFTNVFSANFAMKHCEILWKVKIREQNKADQGHPSAENKGETWRHLEQLELTKANLNEEDTANLTDTFCMRFPTNIIPAFQQEGTLSNQATHAQGSTNQLSDFFLKLCDLYFSLGPIIKLL